METLCLGCDHCRQIPLSKEDIAEGHVPLLKCRRGRFDLREERLLPRWNAPRRRCPDFEGEEREFDDAVCRPVRKHGAPDHVNLREVLPPELYERLREYVRGPLTAYLPREANNNVLHERILEVFLATRSIRGTALIVGCSRNTVRAVVRDPSNAARLGEPGAISSLAREENNKEIFA
jgi:hypothetical protein